MFTIKYPVAIASAFAHLFQSCDNPRNHPKVVMFDAQSRVLVATTGFMLMIVNTDHVSVTGDASDALIPLDLFMGNSEVSVADGWAFAPSGAMAPLHTDEAKVINWRTVYTDPDGGSVALDPKYIGVIMQIHALLNVGKQFLMYSSEHSAPIASVGGNMAHIALAPVMTTDNTQLKLTRFAT